MDEGSDTLSGQWIGRYEYKRGARPVAFEADITEDQGWLSGQISEPNSFRPGLMHVLNATLTGTRTGEDVQFIKTYQGFVQEGTLIYSGTANAALHRIEGRWHFTDLPSWDGRFVMMRKPRAAARATRDIERELEFTI